MMVFGKTVTRFFALVAFLMLVVPAQAALVIDSPVTDWAEVSYGDLYPDYFNDQQTGQSDSDIVGDVSTPAFYTQFDGGGTSSLSDGTLAFRVRVSGSSKMYWDNYLWVGIDADQNGDVDLYVSLGKNNEVNLHTPGSDLNISPSTTSIEKALAAYTTPVGAANYSYMAVNGINAAGLTQDVDGAGGTDWFVSFSVSFNDLVAALAGQSITIDENSALSYIVATSTQGNSLNQDINGAPKIDNSNQNWSWVELGASSSPITASGEVPVADLTAPGAPTGLVAISEGDAVVLDWDDNSEIDFAGYMVYRSSGSGYVAVASNLTDSTFSDRGVVSGTAYTYQVSAADTSGNESDLSSEVSVQPIFFALGNGSFDDVVGDQDDVPEWYDYNSGTHWEGAWVTDSVDIVPNGSVGVAVLSSCDNGNTILSTASTDPLAGSYLYQSMGTNLSGDVSLQVAFGFGAPNDDPGGRELGVSVAVYAYDGAGGFTPGDNVDLRSAFLAGGSGLTLLGSASAEMISSGVDGQIVSTNAVIDLTGSTGQELFLVFNNYRPGDTESWPVLNNVSIDTRLNAPAGLGAVAGDSEVVLDWADSAAADLGSYTVYRSTTSDSGYSVLASNVTESAYTDAAAVNNTSYFYVVTATDTAANESAFSGEVSATPSDMTAPAAPTGLGATVGDSEVVLDWADSAAADFGSYTVYRSTTSGSGYVAIVSNLTDSAYTDSSAINDTTYYYVVTATDTSANESAASTDVVAALEAGPPPVVPDVPTGLMGVGGDNQVDLSWSAVSGATGYRVKRALSSGGVFAIIGTATSSEWLDATATNGTEYVYTVSALGDGGESADSAEISVIPSAPVTAAEYAFTSSVLQNETTLTLTAAMSVPGHTYRVVASPSLTEPDWQDIGEARTGADGVTLEFDIVIEEGIPYRFFKLVVERQ